MNLAMVMGPRRYRHWFRFCYKAFKPRYNVLIQVDEFCRSQQILTLPPSMVQWKRSSSRRSFVSKRSSLLGLNHFLFLIIADFWADSISMIQIIKLVFRMGGACLNDILQAASSNGTRNTCLSGKVVSGTISVGQKAWRTLLKTLE